MKQTSPSLSSRLILNVSPIQFDEKAEIRLGLLPYREREQLQQLRADHQLTHVFRRRDECIQVVSVTGLADDIGESFETVCLSKNLQLTAALVRNALLNYFYRLGRTVLGYDPLVFLAAGPADNLLGRALPVDLAAPPWLSITPRYEAAVRVFYLDNKSPFIGVALDVNSTRRILASCDVLIAEGLAIEGLYVGRDLASKDPRVASKFELLGRVSAVRGDQLFLEDARDELSSVSSAEVRLEGRRDAIDRCINYAFGDRATEIEGRLSALLADIHTGPPRLDRLKKVVEHLTQQSFEMVPGIPFRLGSMLIQGGKHFPSIQNAPKTTYIFDPTNARTDIWHDRGLKTFGPYTSRTFTPSRPRLAVLYQKRYKGQVEEMLHKFLNGIPLGGQEHAPFAQGFVRKYGLEQCTTEFFPVSDDSVTAYDRSVREVLRVQGERDIKWDLVFVQIEERFHSLQGASNPYLVTKAAFLAQQIPVQEFEIETVAGVPVKQLGYVLNNMALASYAKLGGIPWLIQANPTIAHELVVGLGSAQLGTGRLGARQRMVGITTVFTGDGRYHLANLSQATPFEEYREALYTSLSNTVEKVRSDFNWQPGDHIRLVFHAFKDFKDTEADTVKAVMSKLKDFDIEFAFIHVADSHPYLVFDELQKGTWDYTGRTQKGVYAPSRGQFFRLSNSEVLISLTGPKDVKQASHGLPRPILLRLHRASTFTDTTYLARQVFAFASHSWRSFFPSPMPVTILYSELVARLLTQLATVDSSVANAVLGRIGRTRWFL
ncbi:MAG: Piwi domain-containing protein [Acidobacteriota bacterium]